jgi:hypothetical protein
LKLKNFITRYILLKKPAGKKMLHIFFSFSFKDLLTSGLATNFLNIDQLLLVDIRLQLCNNSVYIIDKMNRNHLRPGCSLSSMHIANEALSSAVGIIGVLENQDRAGIGAAV